MSEMNSAGQKQQHVHNTETVGKSGKLSLKTLDRNSIRIVLAAFILMFCYALFNSSTGYYIAPVTEGLGISRTSFNFYYTIMVGMSIFSSPVLAKRVLPVWGITRLVAVGGIICGLSLFAFSLADKIRMIYALSFVIGIFELTCTNVVAVSVINTCFLEKSGSVMGLAMAGSGAGTFVMGALLPALIDKFGWRTGYILQGLFCVLLMLTAARLLRRTSASGSGTGEDDGDKGPVSDAPGMTLSETLRSPGLYLFMAAYFIISLCTCFITQMPAYFTDMGVETAMLSLIMSIAAVALTASKIALGAICDLIGKRLTVIIVLSVYVLSFLILMINGTAFFIIGAVCISIGMSAATVLPPLISRELFGLREYAAIWAVANSVGHAGGAIGGTVWGLLYDLSGSYGIEMKLSPLLLLFVMLIWSSQAKAKEK